MQISKKGLGLIAKFEGVVLKAYPDPASGGEPWTIGIGTTIYPNGKKVKKGDVITEQQAYDYLAHDTAKFGQGVDVAVHSNINQHQFDALVSFSYNVGLSNLKSSTLLKKVNINPSDKSIANEFAKWNKAAGKVMNGLVKRRKAESDLYFLPVV